MPICSCKIGYEKMATEGGHVDFMFLDLPSSGTAGGGGDHAPNPVRFHVSRPPYPAAGSATAALYPIFGPATELLRSTVEHQWQR